jgi:hypothetical protein
MSKPRALILGILAGAGIFYYALLLGKLFGGCL